MEAIMIYKNFKDIKLSALGMGAMRLPQNSDNYADIDEVQTQQMVDSAVEAGVNYFDTAYGYHNGQSEVVIGKALKKYTRDSYYLADKFPGYDLNNMDKVEAIFEEQLKRCDVEYFDFYLIHNVCELNISQYLDEKFGIMDYLLKQKEAGRIRHLGFSGHGKLDVIQRFMDAYGEHMEFCQLQVNWLDWDFQDAKEKVEYITSKGLPVWVMEPLRGGKLANLAEADADKLKALRPDESIAAWSFRFLQTLPEVTMILTGASELAQMEENLSIFKEEKPLSEAEMTALYEIAKGMTGKGTVPCTACRYCTDHCPQELDIPRLLELYNQQAITDGDFIAPMAIGALPKNKRPSACIGCRSCEAVCPQQIKISEALASMPGGR